MSCPLCGNIHWQHEIEQWPSSTHYQCGVCKAEYSVRKAVTDADHTKKTGRAK